MLTYQCADVLRLHVQTRLTSTFAKISWLFCSRCFFYRSDV